MMGEIHASTSGSSDNDGAHFTMSGPTSITEGEEADLPRHCLEQAIGPGHGGLGGCSWRPGGQNSAHVFQSASNGDDDFDPGSTANVLHTFVSQTVNEKTQSFTVKHCRRWGRRAQRGHIRSASSASPVRDRYRSTGATGMPPVSAITHSHTLRIIDDDDPIMRIQTVSWLPHHQRSRPERERGVQRPDGEAIRIVR